MISDLYRDYFENRDSTIPPFKFAEIESIQKQIDLFAKLVNESLTDEQNILMQKMYIPGTKNSPKPIGWTGEKNGRRALAKDGFAITNKVKRNVYLIPGESVNAYKLFTNSEPIGSDTDIFGWSMYERLSSHILFMFIAYRAVTDQEDKTIIGDDTLKDIRTALGIQANDYKSEFFPKEDAMESIRNILRPYVKEVRPKGAQIKASISFSEIANALESIERDTSVKHIESGAIDFSLVHAKYVEPLKTEASRRAAIVDNEQQTAAYDYMSLLTDEAPTDLLSNDDLHVKYLHALATVARHFDETNAEDELAVEEQAHLVDSLVSQWPIEQILKARLQESL